MTLCITEYRIRCIGLHGSRGHSAVVFWPDTLYNECVTYMQSFCTHQLSILKNSHAWVYINIHHLPLYICICTGATVIVVDVVFAFLVCLIILIIGVIIGVALGIFIGVVLGKRVLQKKRELPQSNGVPQERSLTVGTTEVEEESKDHTYAFVCLESSTENTAATNRELDLKTQGYVNMFKQLEEGT